MNSFTTSLTTQETNEATQFHYDAETKALNELFFRKYRVDKDDNGETIFIKSAPIHLPTRAFTLIKEYMGITPEYRRNKEAEHITDWWNKTTYLIERSYTSLLYNYILRQQTKPLNMRCELRMNQENDRSFNSPLCRHLKKYFSNNFAIRTRLLSEFEELGYSSTTKSELINYCKENGIKKYSKLNKKALITHIIKYA